MSFDEGCRCHRGCQGRRRSTVTSERAVDIAGELYIKREHLVRKNRVEEDWLANF
jgi:hypothetical protein